MRFILTFILMLFITSGFAQPDVTEKTTIDGKVYYKHVVEEGQTLWSIHNMYNVPVKDIVEANPDVQETIDVGETLLIPTVESDDAETKVVYKDHTVEKGETLFGISRQYGVKQDQLLEANPELRDGLKEGQIIKIPVSESVVEKNVVKEEKEIDDHSVVPDTSKTHTHIIKDSIVKHVVQRGETLYSLSKRYMVDQDKIREANDGLPDGLKRKDTINIPIRIEIEKIIEKKIVDNDTTKEVTEAIVYKDIYNVVVMVPLQLNKNKLREEKRHATEDREIYGPTKIGVDFYAGIRMAVDSLTKAGLSVNLKVFDTQKDSNVVKKLLEKGDLMEADLIIGPFYSFNVNLVAEFAKEHKIHMVIPVPQRNRVMYRNPYVSKVVTSSTTKIKAMAAYIAENYHNENIILVDSKVEKDKYLFDVMKDALTEELAKYPGQKEPIISYVANYQANHLKGNISKTDTNIVIACSRDIGFATNFMTKLNSVKNSWDKYSAEIKVFVLDDWERFNTIDPLYKNKLNYHFVSNKYIDYDSTNTRRFIRMFRSKYGYDPDEMGFMGFDIAYNYIPTLVHFGSAFSKNITILNANGVHTKFNIEQVQPGSGFENRSIYIIRYQNYDLIPVKW